MSKHATLGICLNIQKREVLLVCEETRRGDAKEGLHWSLPGGKCCNDKEASEGCCAEMPAETMIRESKEETGYDVAVTLLASKQKINPETRAAFIQHIFSIMIAGGNPLRKKVFDTETPQWFPLKKLPKNLYPSHLAILYEFAPKLIFSAHITPRA